LKSSLLIIIIYKEKGKAFIFYVLKKSISLNHALLTSMDIPFNLSGIVADFLGINKDPFNLLIHVSHLLEEELVVLI
jgi:hypothetical protein